MENQFPKYIGQRFTQAVQYLQRIGSISSAAEDIEAGDLQRIGSISSAAEDIEAGAVVQPVSSPSATATATTDGWVIMALGLCFPAAIQLAVLSFQNQSKLFPPLFDFLAVAILLGFSFLVLGEVVKSSSLGISRIFRRLGFFWLVSAFYVAISTPLPLYLRIISLLLYLICLSMSFISIWRSKSPSFLFGDSGN